MGGGLSKIFFLIVGLLDMLQVLGGAATPTPILIILGVDFFFLGYENPPPGETTPEMPKGGKNHNPPPLSTRLSWMDERANANRNDIV